MSYSLFNQECNFTEILFGKSETEQIKERLSVPSSSESLSPLSTDSGGTSTDDEVQKNFAILKQLDDLLEVVDPRVVRLPTNAPEMSDECAPLCTRMPPPGFAPPPPPAMLAQMDKMVADNMSSLPYSNPFSPYPDAFSGFPPIPHSERNPTPLLLPPFPVFPFQFPMCFPNMMPIPPPPSLDAPFDRMNIPPISFWPVPGQN